MTELNCPKCGKPVGDSTGSAELNGATLPLYSCCGHDFAITNDGNVAFIMRDFKQVNRFTMGGESETIR